MEVDSPHQRTERMRFARYAAHFWMRRARPVAVDKYFKIGTMQIFLVECHNSLNWGSSFIDSDGVKNYDFEKAEVTLETSIMLALVFSTPFVGSVPSSIPGEGDVPMRVMEGFVHKYKRIPALDDIYSMDIYVEYLAGRWFDVRETVRGYTMLSECRLHFPG